MAAPVITLQADSPGKGAKRPVYAMAPRALKVAVYDFDQGTTAYNVNGEDLASIWSDFTDVLYIGIEQKDTNTAGDNRMFAIDYTLKKLLIYTAINTESTAISQDVAAVRLFVVGI